MSELPGSRRAYCDEARLRDPLEEQRDTSDRADDGNRRENTSEREVTPSVVWFGEGPFVEQRRRDKTNRRCIEGVEEARRKDEPLEGGQQMLVNERKHVDGRIAAHERRRIV